MRQINKAWILLKLDFLQHKYERVFSCAEVERAPLHLFTGYCMSDVGTALKLMGHLRPHVCSVFVFHRFKVKRCWDSVADWAGLYQLHRCALGQVFFHCNMFVLCCRWQGQSTREEQKFDTITYDQRNKFQDSARTTSQISSWCTSGWTSVLMWRNE